MVTSGGKKMEVLMKNKKCLIGVLLVLQAGSFCLPAQAMELSNSNSEKKKVVLQSAICDFRQRDTVAVRSMFNATQYLKNLFTPGCSDIEKVIKVKVGERKWKTAGYVAYDKDEEEQQGWINNMNLSENPKSLKLLI